LVSHLKYLPFSPNVFLYRGHVLNHESLSLLISLSIFFRTFLSFAGVFLTYSIKPLSPSIVDANTSLSGLSYSLPSRPLTKFMYSLSAAGTLLPISGSHALRQSLHVPRRSYGTHPPVPGMPQPCPGQSDCLFLY